MKNKKKSLSQICLYICIVLCLALIVTQFLPFWTNEVSVKNEEGERSNQEVTLSIWGYLSFPEEDTQKQFGKIFTSEFGDEFSLNNIAGTACLILGLGILSIIFILLKSDKPWTFMFPLACGISGVVGYLSEPVLQIGNLWIVHLILSGLVVAACIYPCIHFIIGIKRWFTEEA